MKDSKKLWFLLLAVIGMAVVSGIHAAECSADDGADVFTNNGGDVVTMVFTGGA